MEVGIFAAVALTLLARTDAGPNAASTIAEAGALAATSFAVFFGLRQWAYRPEPAHVQERPVLAAGGWVPVSNLDPELTTIAAGERHLRALWRARYAVTVYGIALVTLLAYGWYPTSYLGMNNGDGTARVTQAFAAVFSRDPHLGALSLIWPPIPALVDIPLVVLLRPFGQAFLAGSVMGALFMAGAVALLFYVLREVGAGRALAALLTVAFLTHQHVYQSAAAGLSEAPFAMFLLASMLAYLRWLKSGSSGMLAVAGLMAAGATMSRYEAMFWVIAMAFGIVITLRGSIPFLPYFRVPRDRPRETGGAISGSLWAFAAPFGFVMALWMWINIQIKGSPSSSSSVPGPRARRRTPRVSSARGTRCTPPTTRLANR